jgi:transcriptional regulator with XRE-family HTH domain
MGTFGSVISAARKKKGLSQKELASRIKKQESDRESISAQYLNDVEHDRRRPPSEHMIAQLAKELNLSKDRLCLVAGTLPAEDHQTISSAQPEIVESAWTAFRRQIRRNRRKP